MANVDRVNGFRPVGTLTGNPWNAQLQRCHHAAGTDLNLNIGDLVTFSGTADTQGNPGVVIATAGDTYAIAGVVVGIEPSSIENLKNTYMPGATSGYVLVCTDPDVILEAQADEAVAVASVGLNANMVQTTAQASCLGTSGQEVDGTVGAAANNATYQLKIIGFPQRPDNTPAAADNKVLVIINNHVFKGGTGTVGI
jgi:hypothetical protein